MKKIILSVVIFFFINAIAFAQSPCQITLISVGGTNGQAVCQNTPITDITYSVSGTSASVTSLPTGLTSDYNANIFTISGTPSGSGVFNYTVTASGGCTPDADATGSFTVNPLPIANVTGDTTVCQFDPIVHVKFYTSGSVSPYTMKYTQNGVLDTITQSTVDTLLFPVSTSDTGTVVFALLSVDDYNGCYAQIQNDSATIVVEQNATAKFSIAPQFTTLSNSQITINDSTTGAFGWFWDFGDGDTSILANPQTHTYADTGRYTIRLICSNTSGCKDSAYSNFVVVNCDKCYTHFNTTYDTLQNMFTLTIDSLTAVYAKNYSWDFGDGSTSALVTPTHTFLLDSTYTVSLLIRNYDNNFGFYFHEIGKDAQGNIYRTSGFTLKVVTPQLQTAIENNSSNEHSSISPNPFNNQLSIQTDKPSFIKITNISGTEVYNAKVNAGKSLIDTNDFSSGVYFITITDEQTTVTKKLVKE